MSCCSVTSPFPPGLSAQQYRELALQRLGRTPTPTIRRRPTHVAESPIQPTLRPTNGNHMTWAYGITTVPSRFETYFPQTLESLRAAGFDQPRLFVDGVKSATEYERFGLEITTRWPTIRTVGNWLLALQELYIRNPAANMYAIFQDDFLTYKNLRQYLERCPMPSQGYLNLYTFPSNQQLATGKGWYLSNQLGRGAVGLVFTRTAIQTLLIQQHMVQKISDPVRGHRAVDGAIVTAMTQAGWKEYVHNPSLVQHIGDVSSMRNTPHLKATSFKGADFDALELLS